LETIELRIASIFDEDDLADELKTIGQRVSTQGKKEIRRLVGIDIRRDPSVGGLIDSFIEENVKRIRALAGTQLIEVTDVLDISQRGGLKIETVAKMVQDRMSVSKSRAALIARDQTLTLNARIARERMVNLGIEEFIWTTSGDGNVREEHEALEGQKFTFAAGAPGEGLPGEPINCRCTAYPVLPELG
jgi:SPP1 gp7 family putative phage head morphogenesis protein